MQIGRRRRDDVSQERGSHQEEERPEHEGERAPGPGKFIQNQSDEGGGGHVCEGGITCVVIYST